MSAPDLRYASRTEAGYRASWSAPPPGLAAAQARILASTRELEGWLSDDDTRKLVEIACLCGETMLEVGTWAGRSAVVQLLGARADPRRRGRPRLFGVDSAAEAIDRTYCTLARLGLARDAALFRGTLAELARAHRVSPTMVFLDGDHLYESVREDLAVLSDLLAPGVTVFGHDYTNEENATGEYGVRRAFTEWEEGGYAEFCGVFGCGALFVTTARCHGPSPAIGPLPPSTFELHRAAIQAPHPLAARLAAEGFTTVEPGLRSRRLDFALASSHGIERARLGEGEVEVQWIRSPAIVLLDNPRAPRPARLRMSLGSDGPPRRLAFEVNGWRVEPELLVERSLSGGSAAEVAWDFYLAAGDNVLRLLSDLPETQLPDGRAVAFLVLGAPDLELN